MQLLGLSVAQLVGVLLVAASLTTALYLLKQRRRRVSVPFIALWDALLGDRQSSRLFARLQHLFSLLLALCIVALLALALGDPRPQKQGGVTRHTVLIIDAGITMQTNDVPGGRLGAAQALARRIVGGASEFHSVLVAQMDTNGTPLSPMTDDLRLLNDAVDQVTASDLPTDAESAYRLALDVLQDRSRPEIIVISDAAEGPQPEMAAALKRAGISISFLPVGRRNDDVGISAFSVRRYPLDRNRSELFVEVYSGSKHTEQVDLTLLGDGSPIDVQKLTLAPGETLRRVYDDVTGVSKTLEARLMVSGSHNDLAANDHAYAVLPERQRTRVLCVTDGNRYLEAALLLDEYLDVDTIEPAAYRSSDGHDVVIFDGFVPREPPSVPALYIRPHAAERATAATAGRAQPLTVEGEIERPKFSRLAEKHPVLRFTALRDVNVASALLLRTLPGDEVLAADARGPLIVAGQRSGKRFVALAFDIRASDLPLRVAWPLLLLNTIDWFTAESHDFVSSNVVGQSGFVSMPGTLREVAVHGPRGDTRTLPISDGMLALTADRAGFYRLSAQSGDRWLPVNLSPETRRDLTPAQRMLVGTRAAGTPLLDEQRFAFKPFTFLLLAAALLLFADWIAFHRRWTV
jgi:hypothetical protein